MGRLFGTDGVRGVANTELDVELAMKIGKAAAHVLTKETMHKPKILIGKDTRISGDMLEAALSAGLCSLGAGVISLGVIPTPAVAYLTRKYDADAGIVISASHNSAEFNGIKIFNGNGYKLSDDIEDEIEEIIQNDCASLDLPTGDAVGTISKCDTALSDYKAFVKETLKGESLDGLKIAVDCANGASYLSSVETLVELGAEVFVVHNHPNGTNINLKCGSTHTDKFCEYVKNIDVDLGLSFDGDADRLLVVDENGALIDGDKIMLICADYMKEHKMLSKDTLVTTVMTNLGLVNAAKEKGIQIVQTKVGDRYVLEEMLEKGYTLGGEQSGHIICLDFNTTGDGLCSALLLLSILKKTGKRLSELSSVFVPLPQVMVNAKVSNAKKETYRDDDVIMEAIREVEEEFSGNGRVLIRPSGTEPCVRVMIEGPEQGIITQKANYLAKLIEARLV
ncbi:MAG TPA: phosphoglucosamine mutase [Clostridiales bacterium]|uniref:Phosphoglucosamine mutase n=1 Tax=Congzhengia minquanensis TaxID=2763657 RepID=A0A926DJ28_9FIRM|nr:phosphoglucosamine mutase [Congzhengia minquanensis]MBC8539845.1 phosphoglucosamine mutase [Congzhengia minquanensis]MBD8946720.1 phosphoglucosamine mutase [Clostridiales bacterium]HBL81459.1 phosphoglucosamine mutase [Clostridiales bacterium]